MMRFIFYKLKFTFFRLIESAFILLISVSTFAQTHSISGMVTDNQDQTPIPYVNIIIKNTTSGTITDTLGWFQLKNVNLNDTILFSAVGYYTYENVLKTIDSKLINIQLKPQKIDLNEIRVKLDEGPVRQIISKIIENKPKNNPDQYSKYAYRKYTKWEYQINNVGDRIINSKAFKNNQQVFQTASDSSKYLPLYFSEQLVQNEVQKNPQKQKSTIIADKTSGVGMLDELKISGFTSALDMEVNFYNNVINLFTQNFISPLADNGWFYYKYFLADSIITPESKKYQVNFQPRRRGENTFKGYFWTEDTHFAITEVDGDLSATSNLNYLKTLHLNSTYAFVNDSTPFYKRVQMDALFDYVPFKNPNKKSERLSLLYKQSASVDQVVINQDKEIEISTPNAKYETVKLPGSDLKDSLFWEENRMEQLSHKELASQLVIDSVTQIKTIKVTNNIARMGLTNYYDFGKFELGPVTNFFNTNKVEGVHVLLGARTSEEISPNWMFWGALGYGFLNQKINGLGGIGYKLKTTNRQILKLTYDDKYIRHGESDKILNIYENSSSPTENNIISQVFKNDVFDEIFREQKAVATFEHEWHPGLSNKLSASYIRHESPQFYPFERNGNPITSISAVEVKFDTRFSKEEKWIDKGFLRIYMGTEYPIVHFTVGGGEAFYDGQSSFYGLVATTLKQDVFWGQTHLDYAIEGGAYFGEMPYTLLDIPRGNETMGYYQYDFNLLGYLEFVHDRYIHGYFQYHLNGFFFRRVPLLNRANLREVFSARVMVGSIDQKHQQIISFPNGISNLKNPYIEVGGGIENIFSFLRIEAVWRLTPQSIIGTPNFGLRAKFDLTL